MGNWRFYGFVYPACLSLAIIFLYWFFTPKKTHNYYTLLTQADRFYKKLDYLSALSLYEKFVKTYPEHQVVYLVERRIKQIQEMLLTRRKIDAIKRAQLQELLHYAITAYKRERYLTPVQDNSMMYIKQMLILDPENKMAQQIKKLIITNYNKIAEKALKERQYSRAVKNYQKILQITPGNIKAKKLLYHTFNLQNKQNLRYKNLENKKISGKPIQSGSNVNSKIIKNLNQFKKELNKKVIEYTSYYQNNLEKQFSFIHEFSTKFPDFSWLRSSTRQLPLKLKLERLPMLC